MRQVHDLDALLEKAAGELRQTARPFAMLREQTVQAFKPFIGDFAADVPGALRAELRLIDWYVRNRQYVQATILAREWLVDAVAWRLGLSLDFSRKARAPVELALSGIGLVGRLTDDKQTGEKREFTPVDLNEYGRAIYEHWAESSTLNGLWETTTRLRNNFGHAEHQPDALKARPPTQAKAIGEVGRQVWEIVESLNDLANAWQIVEGP
jgi:hypothetical protein